MEKTPLRGKAVIGTETKDMMCDLTEQELADRAQDLAKALEDLDRHTADATRAQKAAGAKKVALQEEVTRLGEIVREKKEERSIVVHIEAMGVDRCAEVRTDTGEILSERWMTEYERQRKLPFEAKLEQLDERIDALETASEPVPEATKVTQPEVECAPSCSPQEDGPGLRLVEDPFENHDQPAEARA